jgi:hypothetical protein
MPRSAAVDRRTPSADILRNMRRHVERAHVCHALSHPRVTRRTPGEWRTIISSAALRPAVPIAFVTVAALPIPAMNSLLRIIRSPRRRAAELIATP